MASDWTDWESIIPHTDSPSGLDFQSCTIVASQTDIANVSINKLVKLSHIINLSTQLK